MLRVKGYCGFSRIKSALIEIKYWGSGTTSAALRYCGQLWVPYFNTGVRVQLVVISTILNSQAYGHRLQSQWGGRAPIFSIYKKDERQGANNLA